MVRAVPELPRLVIEQLTPQLDCGRHPVKRIIGEEFRVEANIFKDGHDLIDARSLNRPPFEDGWQEAPLTYAFDPDLWSGVFHLDRLGRWQYTIQAWTVHYRTWIEDLKKRIVAEQDVAEEL